MKKEKDLNEDPSIPAKEYNALVEELKLPHALMGGTKAMRNAGTEFLPKEQREDAKDYEARLKRSFLFSGYERTIAIMTGEILNKPITISDESPQEIVDLMMDVDMAGNNLTRFAWDFFEWAFINGTGFIFVDTKTPPEGQATTVADDKKLNRRPYWVHVPADKVISVKRDDNMELSEVRFIETVVESVGTFGQKHIEQLRVLYPGRWETFRKNKDEEWVFDNEGKSPLEKISISMCMTGRRAGDFTAKPPMTGLAELNQQHWVSASDQNNILHVCRVPILFGKLLMLDDSGKITISPNNLINSQSEDGDLKYVEHTGKGIGEGWTDLERIEMLMQLWGLDMLSGGKSGTVTATERALTGAKTGSFLMASVQEFQDCINEAIKFTCEMLPGSVVFAGGAILSTDFTLALKSFDNNVLINAFKVGILDRATVIAEFTRRGVIDENADPVEIALALSNEALPSGGFSGGALLG